MCINCNENVNIDTSVRNGHYFLTYPLERSLREVLELHGVGKFLCDQVASMPLTDKSVLSDICSGSLYSGSFPESLSLTCNIDGVPVFKSSNTSLWPVYFLINNLPIEERRKHIVLAGLWYGSKKPVMNCFLKPLVDELVKLHQDGLKWSLQTKLVSTTVQLDLIVVDSVARPLLQNCKQFNGRYGCGFCLHEGTATDKGQGVVRTYPLKSSLPTLRTHEQMLEHAEAAESSGTDVYGVKGVSLLYLIPDFDHVTGFNPEYMHSVLLGVVRQFVNLWFDSSSFDKEFSLRKQLPQIDNVIVSMKPPSEIKRLPRSLTARKFWKASEWRTFLLFYSIVALKSFMAAKFYNHWLLLSFAIYHLMTKPVRRCDLVACDLAVHNFVLMIPSLYGAEHVSFNVHLLTHLVKSVEQWGPLWASSAFVFEDANRQLLRLFHGSNAVSRQIFKSYIALKHLHPLAERYMDISSDDVILKLFSSLSHIKLPCKNVTRFENDVTAFGFPKVRTLNVREVLALESVLGGAVSISAVNTFERVLIHGTVMHTASYSAQIKRNDCFFTLHNHTGVYELFRCVNLPGTNELLFIFRYFVTQQMRCCNSEVGVNVLQHVLKMNGNVCHFVVCRAAHVAKKCIGLKMNKECYYIALPQFELD